MTRITGGEAVVRLVESAGVDTMFGINGAHVDSIYQAALDHGLPIVDTRHEMNAGHGAEGYARVRNGLGVAVLTAGGGFTNGLTSVANAFQDRTPVLYIAGSGTLAGDETNTLQAGIDQVAMAKPVTKWAHRVTRTELIPRIVSRAIRTALTAPRGPVLIDIPWDVLRSELDDAELDLASVRPPDHPAGAAPGAVSDVVALLIAAERPVLVVGSEVVRSGAVEALHALSEAAGVPIFGDYEGLAAASGTPLGLGLVQSLFGLAAGSEPDLVVMVGVRFGLGTEGGSGRLIPPSARVVQVDADARELGHLRPVDLAVVADPKPLLSQLADAVAASAGPGPSRSRWAAELRAHAHRRRATVAERRAQDPDDGRVHPYDAVRTLVDALPENPIVVADGALTYLWLSETIADAAPKAFLCHGYLGTMGLGMGVALGAQAAQRDSVVVLVTGDGAVGYSLGEFDAMVRADLPVVVVVLNNRAWGATLHAQQLGKGADRIVNNRLDNGSYSAVATALGAVGHQVTTIEQLAPAIDAAVRGRRPACIEVQIALDPIPPEERMMFSGSPF